MTTIKIPSALKFSSTPLTVNGKKRNLPHNVEVEVDQAELHALKNSTVQFEMAGSASNDAQQAEAGAERGTAPASPDDDKPADVEEPTALAHTPGEDVLHDPLDHDGDGEKGGSLPGAKSTAAKGAAKKKAAAKPRAKKA